MEGASAVYVMGAFGCGCGYVGVIVADIGALLLLMLPLRIAVVVVAVGVDVMGSGVAYCPETVMAVVRAVCSGRLCG